MLPSSCRPGPLHRRSVFCWAVWRDLTRHPWEKCPLLNVKGVTMAGLEFDKTPHWNEKLMQGNLCANYVFFLTKVMFNHADINLVRCEFMRIAGTVSLSTLFWKNEEKPWTPASCGVTTIMNMSIFCMISTVWAVRKLLRGNLVSIETERHLSCSSANCRRRLLECNFLVITFFNS